MKNLTKVDLENLGTCNMLGADEPDPKRQCDLKCLQGSSNHSCKHPSKDINLPLDTVFKIVKKLQSNNSNNMQSPENPLNVCPTKHQELEGVHSLGRESPDAKGRDNSASNNQKDYRSDK